MIFQIFNKDILKLLTVFSISPGSRFLRNDLKERTKLNNVNLDNAINALLNSNLIKKEKRFLYFNLDNRPILDVVFQQYKELKQIPLNIYFLIIDFIFFLNKSKNIDVYLFWRYSKLIFKEGSDVDLAVISDRADKKKINNITRKLESKYNRKIEVHYFEKNFYKNKKDPIVNEIIKNGVKLIWKKEKFNCRKASL